MENTPVVRDRAWHIEFQLENWARWMSGGGKPDELPDHSAGIGGSHSTSLDDMHDACDLRLAITCDAVISGMEPAEQCALHHQYLDAVYRFNRGQFGATLMMAKIKLASGLLRKGVCLE